MTDDKPDPTEEKRAWLREMIARSNTGGGIFAPKPSTDNDHRSN